MISGNISYAKDSGTAICRFRLLFLFLRQNIEIIQVRTGALILMGTEVLFRSGCFCTGIQNSRYYSIRHRKDIFGEVWICFFYAFFYFALFYRVHDRMGGADVPHAMRTGRKWEKTFSFPKNRGGRSPPFLQ